MEALYTCCVGLDVHKQTVVACLLRSGTGALVKEVRTFGTMTVALIALRDWLRATGCTHAAMEATGSFWKPIYNILEGHCTLLVVNAAHIRRFQGARQTSVTPRGSRPSCSVGCCGRALSRVARNANCAT